MPVTKTVDKISVNGSEIFIYTFNISFSELSVPALSSKLVDFFPNKILYQLPPIGGQLVSINEFSETDGTRVQFNFGNVSAGTSISYTLSSQFGPGRVDNDSFTNTVELLADDVVIDTATAPTVNLILDQTFRLTKFPIITAPVVPGQEILFNLLLKNLNDPGSKLSNIVIEDILPPELIAVPSFTPVGIDMGAFGYTDTTYDGLTGSWTGNTLNFSLPSYSGSSYKIEFKAKVADFVKPGQKITNIANWTANGTPRAEAKSQFNVFEDRASSYLYKEAPKYGEVGKPIRYAVLIGNSGTVELTNYIVTDILPTEVDITEISFFSASGLSRYDLFVETSENIGVYKTVATGISGNSGLYDLTSLIPTGERAVNVRAIIDKYPKGISLSTFNMAGIVNNTAKTDQLVYNKATGVADSLKGVAKSSVTAITKLNGKSSLSITKFKNPNLPTYYPLNEFMISQVANARTAATVDPIFADLLPLGLDYAPGNHYFTLFNNMNRKTYDSNNPGFPAPTPTPEIIKDYQGTGRTLVRFDFTGFTIEYKNRLTTNFNVIVTLNPPTSFENFSYLGTLGDNTEIIGKKYLDINDLDGDGNTVEYIAESNVVTGVMLTTSAFSIEKLVKGDLASNFSKISNVTPGGDVSYKLNITNNQEIDLKNIEIVDILPYVGDTGVILNTTQRGSEFNVYATSVVSAEIVNILGDAVSPAPIINIEYSMSNDPIRFNQTDSGTIGTGTWSTTPPTDITTLSAIRIVTDPSTILKPYERLTVSINAKTPFDTPVGDIAYNSFAVKADKIIAGTLEPMLPIEPNKVSIRTKANNLASIGNFVWEDVDQDGYQHATEIGVNGVVVELYDEKMNLIRSTVTSFNVMNEPGYYSFNNLLEGKYFVKIITPTGYELTIQNERDPNGSKPDTTTGLTNLIVLKENETNKEYDAGIFKKACTNPPAIKAENICLQLDHNFDPLDMISATDCDGSNIILDASNVISNNVDTSVAGKYEVTYKVTSLINGLPSTKTIIVKVCSSGPRQQAITDLFLSIALEQTALSRILHAEGDKIQKAIQMNSSAQELISINCSVNEMVKAISTLEMILKGKIELFTCGGCICGCCNDID